MSSLSRRHFLAAVGTGLGAVRPRQVRPRLADPVVIVGAGLAGLYAATLLRRAGRPVVVLEARGEAGGRVRTIRSAFGGELYGEAGPIRISGAHRRVLKLAEEHRLTLLPFASATGSPVVHVRGLTLRVPEELKQAAAPLRLRADEAGRTPAELLQKYIGELPAGLGDPSAPVHPPAAWQSLDRLTWPDWLKSRGASAGAIALMTLGGDSREASALYVLRQIALLHASTQFYKIAGGMDRLPARLMLGLADAIRYRAEVVRVEQSAGAVAVNYRDRDRTVVMRADRVIFAVPFSMLRRIRIVPAVAPVRAEAIAELPYFPAVRFLLRVQTRFWETRGLSGSARTDDPTEIWDADYEQPGPAGLLAATAGGALGTKLAGLSDDQALRVGVDLIARTFPGLRGAFDAGRVIQWSREPWAQGAFALFHPGQMTAWWELGRADGRLHFAGEHTSPWMTWMEGALESGERAANEVLTQ